MDRSFLIPHFSFLPFAEALGQLTNQNLDQRFSDLETQSAVDSDLAALKQRLGKGQA